MSRLVIGDLHLKVENLHIAREFFNGLQGVIKEKRVSEIIFVGDVYDSKSFVYGKVQNFFCDVVEKLMHDVCVSIVAGNHDMLTTEYSDSLLYPLGLIRVDQYDHYMAADVYNEPTLESGIIYMPYRDKGVIKSFLDEHRGKYGCVIGHFGCCGFDMADGVQDEDGFDPNDYPGVRFILGHYHKPQYKKGDSEVIYVGSPWSHSFGESNQVKNLLLINRDDSFEFLNIRGLPSHITLSWKEYSESEAIPSGPYVRVVGVPMDQMAALAGQDLHLVPEPPVQKEARVDENLSIPAMMEQYIKNGFLPKEFSSLNDDILKEGLKFYEGAKC